jgi:hypothetical protein
LSPQSVISPSQGSKRHSAFKNAEFDRKHASFAAVGRLGPSRRDHRRATHPERVKEPTESARGSGSKTGQEQQIARPVQKTVAKTQFLFQAAENRSEMFARSQLSLTRVT